MADFDQTPGELNITLAAGDDLSLPVQFNISLAGYTFVADMGGQTPTVDSSEAASGLITLTLTDAQSALIKQRVSKWWLKWTIGSNTRTVLAGTFTLVGNLT